MKKSLVTFVSAALLFSCGQSEKKQSQFAANSAQGSAAASATQPAAPTSAVNVAAVMEPAGATPNHAAPAVAPQAPAPGGQLTGTIIETMNSGGYTYMKLKTAQGDVWTATPETSVKKGQQVTLFAQMTADKFESASLKRTFDKIVFAVFADKAQQTAAASAMAGGGKAPAGMGGMAAMGTPSDHMKPKVAIKDVNVEKAEGADAKTVAEVWGGKAALGKKEVVVRGKVVKFLGGIMGTNFMHVRDGSGSDASGDNDLTITTHDVAKVGDVVTVRGVVSVDKDFGAGYVYPVIVENAKLAK